MNNLELLAEALEYMEQHLQDDIHTVDICEACFCSKSTLEKLFRCVNRISVRDYLVRRRMTKAARMLVERPEVNVLDVALAYGYSSHEAFTRAFTSVWNCSPSRFREENRTLDLFPRLYTPSETGDEFMSQNEYMVERSSSRNFDISELYDLFKSRRDCFFVCFDIRNLVPINEISHKAGDLAILEAMKRMEDASGEEDILFRIGGDEFALLTNSTDATYAAEIVRKVIDRNGECIEFEGKQIPLALYAAVVKQQSNGVVRYSELFTNLITALGDAKKEGK